MNDVLTKLLGIWPEIALATGACFCLLLGLWPAAAMRRLTVWVAGLALVVAGLLTVGQMTAWFTDFAANHLANALTITTFTKLAVVVVGILLLGVAAGVPDSIPQIAAADRLSGKRFEPGDVYRGEFFAFFLLSLTGVMLTAGAGDLVWLFLALELTSLPTYVMVATSKPSLAAKEAAVKYFFLGALAAAIFLYGFALIYGATGLTDFAGIAAHIQAKGLSPLMLTGLVLAVVGIAFKIAAVPMHFYAADVYQGAATPVTAFLAFVPKTAGFVALVTLLNLARVDAAGHLPQALVWLLWIIAALTMTIGNTLGLMQSSVKRVLAYSSIAHSGYMLVGLIVGVGGPEARLGNGIAAVLFYLVAYGLATLAAFAVLGCVRVNGREADSFADLHGLSRRQPVLAAIMLISLLSLIGLPPMVGFLGKIYLFGSALAAAGDNQPEMLWLVIIAVVNSAISAVYYLRIIGACYFVHDGVDATPGSTATTAPPGTPGSPAEMETPSLTGRIAAAGIAAALALVLGVAGGPLVDLARDAAKPRIAEASPADQPSAVARGDVTAHQP